jgi:SAM-dependent methyltransferase
MRPWTARLYVWATYRLYHEFAWAYDATSWLVSLGQWAGWRRAALDYVPGLRVLEIGFGTGELLVEMGRRDLAACGLDYSRQMQRIAARKLHCHELEVPRVRGVTQAMPFADGCFDAIVSTFPAGYILDPATLREAARLLRRPGGRLVVGGRGVHAPPREVSGGTRPAFGVPGEDVVDHFVQVAAEADLHVSVDTLEGRFLRLPVILAERRT